MKISTKQMLNVLYVLSWVIFLGLCIEAGGFIFNAFFTQVLNPVGAKYFWQEIDLSSLYKYDHVAFFTETFVMCAIAVIKAYLFYLIVKILYDKKLNTYQPFNEETGRFVLKVSYVSLLIGSISWCGCEFTEWLVRQGVVMPDIQYLRLSGGDVWLLMGVTLFVIAQIFQRGIEIQTENDLTI